MANEPGHWVYRRHLGAGAFGVVQLWQNDYTNEMIAIKKQKSDSDKLTEKQRVRWINEVETMNSVRHPNIVGTRPVPAQLSNFQASLPLLCMEYCCRGDLRAVLNQSTNCCGIEEQEARRIMHDVASAVAYLHSRNFTHRDLKPENIVIHGYGKEIVYKLTDLGYVCELGEMTVDRSVVGTLNYLAPELFWKEGYTCSVDYWGLGILFYEIVTGNIPFHPDTHAVPTWVSLLQKKSNDCICAREEDGHVLFSKEIERPTTVSDCMRNELTTWFRVALQWDPKSRGRIKDAQGSDELIVFSLLKSILSWKILYIFAVPHYRVDSYAVNRTISLRELQILIYEKTKIEVAHQIVSDIKLNVLSEPSSSVISCIEDFHLIVFHKECLRVNEPPDPKMSPPIQRMIFAPQKSLNHETNRRYYRAAVFFVKQELELFRSYVIALSIKIDLSNMAHENLCETVKTLTDSTNNLTRELALFAQSPEYGRMRIELRESLDTTRSKTQKLVNCTEEVAAKISGLARDFENLKTISETHWLENWMILHKKATDYLEAVVKENRMQPSPPVEMVKLLYSALKLQKEQLRSTEIDSFVSRIEEFERNIIQLRAALTSSENLVDHYRKNYEEIVSKGAIEEQNSCLAFMDSMTPNDTVIFDSIVLRNLIESLDGFHPSIEDMEDLDFY